MLISRGNPERHLLQQFANPFTLLGKPDHLLKRSIIVERRVVVTGVGLITPVGIGREESWRNICDGTSGVSHIERFDTSDYGVKIAAEIKDFKTENHFEKKAGKHLDLFVQYGIVATRMAMEDSGFEVTPENCERVGVITGCGMGGYRVLRNITKSLSTVGRRG